MTGRGAPARSPSSRADAAARLVGALAGCTLLLLLTLPIVALVVRTPVHALAARLASPLVQRALWLSLETATGATILSVLGGLPLAHALARRRVPAPRLVEAIVTLPLVLPPTVAGLALLLAFGRAGVLGGALDAVGVQIPFTTLAVVLAQTFVAAPFFIAAARAALEDVAPAYEEAAAALQATRLRTLARVTLPLVRRALLAGAAMTWARALGEFGATITFAGNFPGRTQTMPLAVYLALQSDTDAAVTLGVLLLAVACAMLAAVHGAVPFLRGSVAAGAGHPRDVGARGGQR